MRQWSEVGDAERQRILAECVIAVGNRLRGCDVHRGALVIEVQIVETECTCYEFVNGHQAGCPMRPLSEAERAEVATHWEFRLSQVANEIPAYADGRDIRTALEEIQKLRTRVKELESIVADIETIRSTEGNCVTINCDNPEAGGAELIGAVDVVADFCGLEEWRFYGRTWVDALHAAADAARQHAAIEKNQD